MTTFELLIGKKMMVETDMGVTVELEISSIEEEFNSVNLEPATADNNWWPASRDWRTYKVTFTTGKSKVFSSINDIKVH